MSRLSGHLRRAAWAVALLCCARAAAEPTVIFDFEDGTPAWQTLVDGHLVGAPCPMAETAASGRRSLQVDARFPGTVGAGVAFWQPLSNGQRTRDSGHKPQKTWPIGAEKDDLERAKTGRWHPFTHLSLKVYVPQDAPAKVRAMVFLKDGNLNYYQHLRLACLPRGRWTGLTLDLTAGSADWQPHKQFKPWDGYCRQDVTELGVKFTCESRYEGPLLVDSIALHTRAGAEPEENAILNLRANASEVGRYEKFEASFNLARTYSNPFDPEVVDALGHFIGPDGNEETVPAFFYQGYLRRREGGAEKLTPMGRSQWKIRYAPRKPGRHYYYITVADGGMIRSDLGTFRCVESESRGFVRMSKADPDYFEFSDGSFYYPIGHNIAAVRDARAEKMGVYIAAAEGTYAYDRFLSKMGANGENFGRVWMSPWSFEIEWTKDYAHHFEGLGRYSLYNSWRLDHLITTAEERGIYLMLLIASHGEITDHESNFYGAGIPSQGSPYWQRNGGPLQSLDWFYSSADALKYYRRQVRYIAARWGYSTAVMSWEILNEPDLYNAFRPGKPLASHFGPQCAKFIQELIREVRRHDPAAHLVTTSLWQHWSPHTAPVLRIKELDFFAGHVFHAQLPAYLRSHYDMIKDRYGKVMFVTEADASPFPRGTELTLRYTRVPIWSSFMTSLPGAACPWWWVLIDQKNAYGQFGALARFAEGEERRGKNYRPITTARAVDKATEGKPAALQIECMGNRTQAFCWVYNTQAYSAEAHWLKEQAVAASVRIPGLDDGAYTIEIWDTDKGAVITSKTADSRGGNLEFDLPPFSRDIACKIIRIERPETHQPPAPARTEPAPVARPRPPEQEHTLPD